MKNRIEEILEHLKGNQRHVERSINRCYTENQGSYLEGKKAALLNVIGLLESLLNEETPAPKFKNGDVVEGNRPIDWVEKVTGSVLLFPTPKLKVGDVIEVIDGPFKKKNGRIFNITDDFCNVLFELESPYYDDIRGYDLHLSNMRLVKDPFPTHTGGDNVNVM